jgi:hypothetical protein
MNKFEEMGRELDEALERLRAVAEQKVSPATRVKAAKALRSVSGRLAKLAEDIESQSSSKER